MKITFLGGADEVGASCTLIDIDGLRLLVDVGIRISARSSRGIANSQLPDLQPITEVGGPDYILVTHAHTDHTGALPMVVEQYPHVPVLMTRPTFALTRTLQQDAQRIMKSRQEEEGELPLFDEVSVQRLMDAVQLVEFNQPIKLGENAQVTYHVSGHIAGAGLLVIESTRGTLVMSGDVSKSAQRTVKSIEVPRIKADALVLESTYGGRLHANRRGEEIRLIEMLKRITDRGGKVLIPAFALGRAQEVLQIVLAYRDQFNLPVYADGMVRSVCNAYHQFSDLLPEPTVRAAREEHLFWRKGVQAVRNAQHRQEIATSAGPAVIVASSGMLTGGASVYYAKHFVGDERNAILLTGYQDEEAPGRFLQRIMRERDKGETPTLNLDGKAVEVRCEIDTYSLSAHADEAELVAIAQALKASEVLLVHGDESARHSLATALRQRQIAVTTPRIGTVREFHFASKPWGIGAQVASGQHTGEVDLEKLWDSVKAQAGSTYTVRELSQAWWGDTSREPQMQAALDSPNNIFFAQHWRTKTNYAVRTPEQVERSRRQRAIMLANPDIVGKLVVLRNSNEQPRIGIIRSADVDSFTAEISGAKGSNYPADSLLWVIGDWQGYGDESLKGTKNQLRALLQNARAAADMLMPLSARRALVQAETAVDPASLLPDELPGGIDRQTALTAIVLALADDHAVVEQGGLRPQRAYQTGPLEQNEARNLALTSFPPEARLRKVGMEVHRRRLTLGFDFPQVAEKRFAEQIEQLAEQTGWDVAVKQNVNQLALSEVLTELLPEGASISKGPSFFMDRGQVSARLDGVDNLPELRQSFRDETGFELLIDGDEPATAGNGPAPSQISPAPDTERMEINAAYAHIKAALNEHGLTRTSLKQGQIVLSFISPQVGARHQANIDLLAQQTGYPLDIHPHPNQQMILQAARQRMVQAGWIIRKGPGIHMDRGAISVSLAQMPDEAAVQQVTDALLDQTGYTLEVSV